jgi:hypothetical protein
MLDLLLLFIHMVTTLVRLVGPGGVRSVVACRSRIRCRAINWNDSPRILGSLLVLERCRFGIEASGVQALLQSASNSLRPLRQNTGRASYRQFRQLEVIYMEGALRWSLSHADCCLIRNSPGTGFIRPGISVGFRDQFLVHAGSTRLQKH